MDSFGSLNNASLVGIDTNEEDIIVRTSGVYLMVRLGRLVKS
jgi:hypothetical protein